MSEQKKIQDKIILITGASSGIGQATAFEFAKHNFKLAITYSKNEKGIIETNKKCKSLGSPQVEYFKLDLTNDQSIKNCVKQVVQKYKYIDILINNAGYLKHGDLKEQTFESIDSQLRTNLEGLIKITKECLPFLKQSIINIAGNLGLQSKKRLSVYSATKFGVRGFTKSLAKEFPEFKIYTVNPGLTATRMGDFKGMTPEKVAEIVFNTALGKYRVRSGGDIDVKDYKYGKLRKLVIFLRTIKNFFT